MMNHLIPVEKAPIHVVKELCMAHHIVIEEAGVEITEHVSTYVEKPNDIEEPAAGPECNFSLMVDKSPNVVCQADSLKVERLL